ncbi:succinylglutamate desuccinylase [Halobacteriales archaeon QS_4_62_28]|nr:MAG: succinylglutamate desuccinylase [Halobacteriales archaeon QS_4_62_28]
MYVEQLGSGDPDIAVVGGIHGDEPCGVHAVETLIEEAPAVERSVALVVANEAAIERDVRYVDTDLNRSFPGDHDSEAHEERLAAALVEEIGDCTTLALHSTQSYEDMFALVDTVGEMERRICAHLSIDAVVETHRINEGRIFSGIPETVELECGYQRSERARANAVQVTREFLRTVDALPGGHERPRAEIPMFDLGDPIPKAMGEVYEVFANNFEPVAAGEAFAATDGDPVVAETAFHPVLLSPEGYENVFGYMANPVGTI